MQTQDAIRNRFNLKRQQPFNFEPEVLIDFLDYDHISDILNEGVSREAWNEEVKPLTRYSVTLEMEKYMDFALEKVVDHRGLSAVRNIQKFTAWLWLLEDHKTLSFAMDDTNYPQYGAPILRRICEAYGFDARLLLGDRRWEYFMRMSRGEPCQEDCREGCGEYGVVQ